DFLSRHITAPPAAWKVLADHLRRDADSTSAFVWNAWDLRSVHIYSIAWGLTLLLVALTFVVPPFQRWRRAILRGVLDRILEYLDLNHGLGNTYALKQQLIACFDREYYGKVEIEEVLKRASNGT